MMQQHLQWGGKPVCSFHLVDRVCSFHLVDWVCSFHFHVPKTDVGTVTFKWERVRPVECGDVIGSARQQKQRAPSYRIEPVLDGSVLCLHLLVL